MDPVKNSLISLHLTVMLLGGTALFSQLIALNSIDITFGRSIFACILLTAFVLFSGESIKLNNRQDYLFGLLLGALMSAHWVTYFMAMQYAGVSVGIIALFTFPVITVLLEPYFEKLKLVWQDIASTLVVIIGIYLIIPDKSLGNDVTVGIIVGVFSALLYSLRNLLHRKYFSHYSGSKAMAFQTLVICPSLVFFISDEFFTMGWDNLSLLILLGTLFTAVPHALIANALKHLRAKTFSLVACMQPFYGVAFAIIVLNENPSLQTLFGGVLVISAAIYETVTTHRSNKDK